MKTDKLRYSCTGEVHLDFHGLLLATAKYLLNNFGEDGLSTVIDRTAKQVYRVMHEKLKAGDTSEFIEFQRYYLTREGGDFTLTEAGDGEVEVELRECPGVRQILKIGLAEPEMFCDVCKKFQEALCDGTPWCVETEKTGICSCRQKLKRRNCK